MWVIRRYGSWVRGTILHITIGFKFIEARIDPVCDRDVKGIAAKRKAGGGQKHNNLVYDLSFGAYHGDTCMCVY
jgi:hypothetical protein